MRFLEGGGYRIKLSILKQKQRKESVVDNLKNKHWKKKALRDLFEFENGKKWSLGKTNPENVGRKNFFCISTSIPTYLSFMNNVSISRISSTNLTTICRTSPNFVGQS